MGKHYASNLAVVLLLTLLTADATPSIDMDKLNFGETCKANPCSLKQVPVPIRYVFLIVTLHVTNSLVYRDYVFTSNGCGMAGAPMKGYEFVSDCCDLHDAVCIRIYRYL